MTLTILDDSGKEMIKWTPGLVNIFSLLIHGPSPLLSQPRDTDLERTESTFISLVQSLLKDPTERAYFFQVITAGENPKLALFWTDDVHDISAV